MSIKINNGIQLPAFDVEMLSLGRLIAVPFNQSYKEGKVFWLYPSQKLPYNLTLEQYYQLEYLTKADSSFRNFTTYPIHLKAWARCERQWRINSEQKHLLPKIAQSTIWNLTALEHIFEQYQVLKLLIVRVYRLSSSCIVNVPVKPGEFYWPQSEDLRSMGDESNTPVVSEASFNQRKTLFLSGKTYPYREIETLQFQCGQILEKNPAAQQLDNDIKIFLGWSSEQTSNILDSDIAWIKTIAEIGNSSDGHTFEKLVRRGLLKLGFTGSGLNPEATGGAGGMDFYTETPYPIVGECKATKSEKVPDGTPAQLLRIGITRLGKIQYENAIKLIVAAGELNRFALSTATEHQMNVISPETLQKLVELQTQYKNSVNLLELKQCLQQVPFGLADDKVNSYIAKVEQDIKLRSHIIQVLKNYLELAKLERAGVEALHAAYITSHPPQPLNSIELREILIELSSPLTGYVGRIKGEDWRRDRFYYLRDLPIN
ncbi:hypothetical protein NIES4074_14360 [Cylindrospermum sp. NIES-4074]|nr:hypothetical protein NIES4074_14360 [Cylindrospermum sp. NIES-4074]